MTRLARVRSAFTAGACALLLVACSAAADRGPTAQEWADSLRHVQVNGAELAVLDLGQGEPVVFVHGTSADYRTWIGEIEPFARRYRVIAYSRRYHFPNQGGGGGRDYSIALHEQDLVALVEKLGLGKVTVVGHAAGAEIAAQFAADYPELVRSAVLVEPMFPELMKSSARGSEFADQRRMVIERARQALTNDFPDLGFDAVAGWEFGDDWESSIPRSVRQRLAQNVTSLKYQVLSPVRSAPFGCERIQSIRCPVLYVDGAKSPWHAGAMAEEFVKCRPATERITLKNATHGMVWDDSKTLTRVVFEFLDRRTLAGE